MKGVIAAAAVLLLVTALVILNAVYVRRTTDGLLAAADALPDIPDPSATPQAVAALRAAYDRRLSLLSLSVSYTVLDRVEEALCSLEAHAAAGDGLQYAAALALLRDLMRDIARAERLHPENIF